MGTEESTSASGNNNSMASNGAIAMMGGLMGGLMGSVKEKWDVAGGNQVISNVTAALPQGTNEFIAQTRSKMFNRAYLRSPTVFFGLGEEKAYYFERSLPLIMPRLRHNLTFFYLNYMLITAVLFVLTLLISPGAIIGIGLLGLAWVGVVKATQEGSITVKGITITQKQASVAMAVVSVLVLFYLLSNIFWWTLASSGFLVGIHALLRDASMHKDEEDKVEMTGDITVSEDARFLNAAENEL